MAKLTDFKEECYRDRELIEAVKEQVQGLRADLSEGRFEIPADADPNEIIENVKLAYRHLEDARMRIGKALQAYQGRGASMSQLLPGAGAGGDGLRPAHLGP
jgi:hypothetical protein